jgi:hypothetical protein
MSAQQRHFPRPDLPPVPASQPRKHVHKTFGRSGHIQITAFQHAVCIALRAIAVELLLPFHQVGPPAVFLDQSADAVAAFGGAIVFKRRQDAAVMSFGFLKQSYAYAYAQLRQPIPSCRRRVESAVAVASLAVRLASAEAQCCPRVHPQVAARPAPSVTGRSAVLRPGTCTQPPGILWQGGDNGPKEIPCRCTLAAGFLLTFSSASAGYRNAIRCIVASPRPSPAAYSLSVVIVEGIQA